MKKILIVLLVSVFTIMQAEAFDWGSALNFMNAFTANNEVQSISTLDDIEKQMSNIDASVQTAFINIVSEFSSRKVTNNIKSDLKNNNMLLNEAMTNYLANYLNDQNSVASKIKKMSTKEKTALINNIVTLSQAGQDYLLLATDGIKTATNSIKTAQKMNEVTNTIINVNKVGADLKNRATSVINFANQLKTIASNAGLNVQ